MGTWVDTSYVASLFEDKVLVGFFVVGVSYFVVIFPIGCIHGLSFSNQ